MEDFIRKIAENKKNYVFIGEAGSGKTETALNYALALKEKGDRKVHFFDMDQTKPLLRARDSSRVLEDEGVTFHCQWQYLDSPVVASGVIEALNNEDYYVILDVGGGSHGSHMIGQFAEYINRDNTEVFYLINPYRPWSGSREDIDYTMSRVLGTASIRATSVIANPNLGYETDLDTILKGVKKVEEMFPDVPVKFVVAMDEHRKEVEKQTGYDVFPINLNTLLEWLD